MSPGGTTAAAAAAAWVGIPTFESSYFYRQFHSNSSIFGPRNGPTFNSGTSVRLLSLGPTDGTSRGPRDRWWGPGSVGVRRSFQAVAAAGGGGDPGSSAGVGQPGACSRASSCQCEAWDLVTYVHVFHHPHEMSKCMAPPHNVRINEIRGHILICSFAIGGAMGFMIY